MSRKIVVLIVLASVSLFSMVISTQSEAFMHALKVKASQETLGIYNSIESFQLGSIVILSFDFGPSTISENRPQAEAFLFHCKQKGLKVIGVAFWATGAPIGEEVFTDVYRENFEDLPEYGTELVYIGFIPGGAVGMRTLAENTWTAISVDHFGNSFSDLPLMNEVRSAADFEIWMEVMSGTPGVDEVITYIQTPHGGPSAVPVSAGCTETVYSGIETYYNAGQLAGILKGLKGASEYELLLMEKYRYPPSVPPPIGVRHYTHTSLVPFEGMTLKWSFHSESTENGETYEYYETWLCAYKNWVNKTSIIKVAEEITGKNTYYYYIEVTTRELTTPDGYGRGAFTSHWIPADISIGDKIYIGDVEFEVVSKSEDVYVSTIRDGTTIKCAKLEYTHAQVIESLFYDINRGIKVKYTFQDEGWPEGQLRKYNDEAILVETGIDNDADGLTDYEELFVTLTNPQKSDSDNDYWNDSIDMMPNSMFVPNGVIGIIIAIIIAVTFLSAYTVLRRKH